MTDFVLEIFSEEIPAKMQKNAAENFAKIAAETFQKNHLEFSQDNFQCYVAPCRLALILSHLPLVLQMAAVKKTGPKTSADPKAIQGFLKANAIQNIDQLEIEGEFYVLNKSASEISVAKILEISLPQILQKMQNSWPKLMSWNTDNRGSQAKWIRPVRNILAIFGENLIACEFFGVSANKQSFNKKGESFEVNNSRDYEHILEKNSIILNQEKRRQSIISQIHKLSFDHKIKTFVQLDESNSLLAEVVGLCENPEILVGEIEKKFLNLPVDALILTLQSNQRYFCCLDFENNLSSKFLFAIDASSIDLKDSNIKKIIADNEKVVKARLSDLDFFIEQDLSKPLATYSKMLNKVVFHQKLGSLADKIERIKETAKFLSIFVPHCDITKIDKAVDLCKADLMTKAVAEMPELQGKIGSFYAEIQHEIPEIVDAIYEHYLPTGPNSELPTNSLSIAIAIADKIDSIVGFFLIGEKPTSSKDPYALRRYALGLVRILLSYKLSFPIRILIEKSIKSYAPKIQKVLLGKEEDFVALKNKIVGEISCFILERLKVYLREKELLAVEVVSSVIDQYLAEISSHKFVDLLFLVKKTRFIDNFLKNPANADILALYRRCNNILTIYEKKENRLFEGKPSKFRLKKSEEKILHQALKAIKTEFSKKIKDGDFENAYLLIATLEQPLSKFFENVLVADEDENLRENRLMLLSDIRSLFNSLCNLSQIENSAIK